MRELSTDMIPCLRKADENSRGSKIFKHLRREKLREHLVLRWQTEFNISASSDQLVVAV